MNFVPFSEYRGRSIPVPGEDRYWIDVPDVDFMVLRCGYLVGERGAAFAHPNVVANARAVLEFKHDCPRRGKFWTSKVGGDFIFVVPSDKIEVALKAGHSYVTVRVNGAEFILNVSGSTTGDGGWRDFFGQVAATLVGLSQKTLRSIADVSVPPERLVSAGWTIMRGVREYGYEKRYREMLAAKIGGLSLKKGSAIVISETARYCPGHRGLVEGKRGRDFDFSIGEFRFSTGPSSVDWLATLQANGMELGEIDVAPVTLVPPSIRGKEPLPAAV